MQLSVPIVISAPINGAGTTTAALGGQLAPPTDDIQLCIPSFHADSLFPTLLEPHATWTGHAMHLSGRDQACDQVISGALPIAVGITAGDQRELLGIEVWGGVDFCTLCTESLRGPQHRGPKHHGTAWRS